MSENPNIKFMIAFNDPDLDPEERDEQAKRFIAELKQMDEVDVDQQGVKSKLWKEYPLLSDEVEKLTRYDFFSNLPKEVQQAIEAKVDRRFSIHQPTPEIVFFDR